MVATVNIQHFISSVAVVNDKALRLNLLNRSAFLFVILYTECVLRECLNITMDI